MSLCRFVLWKSHYSLVMKYVSWIWEASGAASLWKGQVGSDIDDTFSPFYLSVILNFVRPPLSASPHVIKLSRTKKTHFLHKF